MPWGASSRSGRGRSRRPTPTWPWTWPGTSSSPTPATPTTTIRTSSPSSTTAAGNCSRWSDVAITPVAETNSSVAMTPDGRFDVAWEQAYSPTDHDIYLKRYSAAAASSARIRDLFQRAYDSAPSVAMDNAGNAVVAWEQGERHQGDAGQLLRWGGGRRSISPAPRTMEFGPSVALRPDGGGFVVAYEASIRRPPEPACPWWPRCRPSTRSRPSTRDAERGGGEHRRLRRLSADLLGVRWRDRHEHPQRDAVACRPDRRAAPYHASIVASNVLPRGQAAPARPGPCRPAAPGGKRAFFPLEGPGLRSKYRVVTGTDHHPARTLDRRGIDRCSLLFIALAT